MTNNKPTTKENKKAVSQATSKDKAVKDAARARAKKGK